jgi:hypothetical protein
MNESKIIGIFKDLQDNNHIHKDRVIKPSPKFKICYPCSFVSNILLQDSKIFNRIVSFLKLTDNYIEYDIKEIKFLDDPSSPRQLNI